jgi:hypothetical protein
MRRVRELLRLHYGSGASARAIARELGVSRNSEGAPVLEIGGDPGRPETVIAKLGVDPGRGRTGHSVIRHVS